MFLLRLNEGWRGGVAGVASHPECYPGGGRKSVASSGLAGEHVEREGACVVGERGGGQISRPLGSILEHRASTPPLMTTLV